ncbi:MAG: hypothetical protein LBK41_06305 [Clostridiales bacterium]|jgi:hypothetical protein|nr:hypothetical protein [Clostridiales bacterium]
MYFFENAKHSGCRFEIDERARTVTAIGDLPRLFYYWSGNRNKPYTALPNTVWQAILSPQAAELR